MLLVDFSCRLCRISWQRIRKEEEEGDWDRPVESGEVKEEEERRACWRIHRRRCLRSRPRVAAAEGRSTPECENENSKTF